VDGEEACAGGDGFGSGCVVPLSATGGVVLRGF
jgi:hypothetical protein